MLPDAIIYFKIHKGIRLESLPTVKAIIVTICTIGHVFLSTLNIDIHLKRRSKYTPNAPNWTNFKIIRGECTPLLRQ